jgi:hypothetical protein
MTITRTLSLVKPLLMVRPRHVTVLIGLFVLYEIIIVSLAFSATIHFKFYWIELAALPTILTTLIIISCVISIIHLLVQNKHDINTCAKRKRNVDASITVLILAGLFCLFNIPFCVVHIWECVLGPGSLYGSVHNYDIYVFIYSLCVPLNSAINPVVYFTRNQKLRLFIINQLFCNGNNNLGTIFWRSEVPTSPRHAAAAVAPNVSPDLAVEEGCVVKLGEIVPPELDKESDEVAVVADSQVYHRNSEDTGKCY